MAMGSINLIDMRHSQNNYLFIKLYKTVLIILMFILKQRGPSRSRDGGRELTLSEGYKALRSLNTVSDLGMRNKGFTFATCSAIFWSLVVPTAL